MHNWILRADFDEQYRAHGMLHWLCGQGHRNSVLPTQEEIDEMNRNILLHPEYYTEHCACDTIALRRFRLCPDCVTQGLLTFAVHEAGCKMWPGSAHGHRHRFCFHCTAPWASVPDGGGGCSHATRCRDPGIQQVRRATDSKNNEVLEIGFINGKDYIDWVSGGTSSTSFLGLGSRQSTPPCPPTCFRGNTEQVQGKTRQGQLGLEDVEMLRKTIHEGTT
mmetsp:Transcript_23092/g.58918  ORF Transcript_23092/g.58918 Transcript_23092/m.58918 type:complete len:220 (-) Transcript_23092:38-697(-)